MTVDSAEGATFPYAWYFRHLQTGYVDLQQAERRAADERRPRAHREQLRAAGEGASGYDCRQFDFRVWWVRDYGGAIKPGNVFRYLTQREAWNPTGGMKQWLCKRKAG